MNEATDGIDVHFDAKSGELSLDCGGETFLRLLDAIVAAAELNALAIDGVPSKVRLIVVREAKPIERSGKLGDKLAVFGCALLAAVIFFVFAVGVGTIVGWF